MNWAYKSEETNLEVIFAGPKSYNETVNPQEQEDIGMVSDAKSIVGYTLVVEAKEDMTDGEIEFQGGIFYGAL